MDKQQQRKQLPTSSGKCCTSGVLCVASVALCALLLACASFSVSLAAPRPDAGELAPLAPSRTNWATGLRLRRQAALAAAAEQQQENNQREDEREFIKRQLPDLMAQAHNDKLAERAFLKMLIEASLRSSLRNLVSEQSANSQQQQQQQVVGSQQQPGRLASWQVAELEEQLNDPRNQLAALAARLGRADDQEQWLDQDGGPMQQVDKREYLRPCSFNAISCVRTPFRKS